MQSELFHGLFSLAAFLLSTPPHTTPLGLESRPRSYPAMDDHTGDQPGVGC